MRIMLVFFIRLMLVCVTQRYILSVYSWITSKCLFFSLVECDEFKKKAVPECYEVAKSFKVCFNCLKQGHQVNKCSNKTHCPVTNCKRHHHSLLHYERATPQPPLRQNPQTQPLLTSGNALPYMATTNFLAANERVVYLSRSKYKVKTGGHYQNVCYSG